MINQEMCKDKCNHIDEIGYISGYSVCNKCDDVIWKPVLSSLEKENGMGSKLRGNW